MRDQNEDAYLVRPPVYAVADGMGGHAAGEVASRLALQSVADARLRADGGAKAIQRALEEANRIVYQVASGEGPSRGMGTTCVVLVVANGAAHIGHVGDSRVYLLRNGSLNQLTRDHTVVADMIEKGLMTHRQALADSARGLLTRALGGGVAVDADVRTVAYEQGDRFLLCSDGLTTMLTDDEIQRILEDEADPQIAADRLVAAAIAAGGEDNVTTLVVDPPGAVESALVGGRQRTIALIQAAIVVIALVLGILVVLLLNGPFGGTPDSSSPPAMQQTTTLLPAPGSSVP